MAEREQRLDPARIMVPIADKDALMIGHMTVLAGIDQPIAGDGRIVGQLHGEGLRQPSAWLCKTEEYIGNRIACLLAGIPGLDDGRHLGEPGHFDRTASLEHNDGARIDGGDPLDQFLLAAGQAHVGQVEAFGVPLPFPADNEHRDVAGLRLFHGFGDRRI